MKVEYFKVFAEQLGLENDIDELIRFHRYVKGEYALTKKGKKSDYEKYLPLYKEQRAKITKRLGVVFPEWKGWKWSFGRTSSNECYVSFFNPEWE